METTENETNTALTLDHAAISTVFSKSESTQFIELIDKEVMTEFCDVTTKEGRARERSLSGKISSFKADMGRLSDSSIQEFKDIITSNREYMKGFNAECDKRRDTRKAATIAHEAKEQARKDGHRASIELMQVEGYVIEGWSLEGLEQRMKEIESTDFDALEEFKEEGARVAAGSISKIAHRINAVKEKADADAEIARLQQKEAARKCIGYISRWSNSLHGCGIDDLRLSLREAAGQSIDYDFGDLQAEADETRANTIKDIEDAITAEEKRLEIQAENKKLKDAAQKVKDDEQDVIDAAKLAEDQKEDGIWEAAHIEDGLRQDVKDKAAEEKRIEDEKADAAKEKARLASEDKEHRAKVINQAINAIHDGANDSIAISKDQAAVVVDLITAGFVPAITMKF